MQSKTVAEMSAIEADFIKLEYSEASRIYFKEVDIGISYIRLFFIINAVLFTSFFTSWKFSIEPNSAPVFQYLLYLVIFIGLSFSALLLRLLTGYKVQLKNCLYQVVRIENQFNGKLFNSIKNISDVSFSAITGLYILTSVFILAWMFLLLLILRKYYFL